MNRKSILLFELDSSKLISPAIQEIAGDIKKIV